MAAVDEDGRLVIATDRHSERCSGTNARGNPCRAWRLRDQEVCLRHSMTDDEWRAFGRKGGRKRQGDRREVAGLRKSSGHRQAVPGPLLAKAIAVVAELLDAVIPDGSGEPNMQDRSYGVLCLAALFGLRDDQRAEILELLGKVRPALVNDPQRDRLLRLEEAKAALLRAVEEGRLDPLDLPPDLVGLQNVAA